MFLCVYVNNGTSRSEPHTNRTAVQNPLDEIGASLSEHHLVETIISLSVYI